MANITITVQSLLNAAQYDSYTIDNGQTINQLKTAIQTATDVDPTWYNIVFNNAVVSGTSTLAAAGIVNGSALRTANIISRLATLQDRQVAKLELAQLERLDLDNPYPYYDIDELPTQYDGNNIVDNPNPDGLIEGRPWVDTPPAPDVVIPAGMDRNEPYNGSGGSNPTVPGTLYKTAASRGVPAFNGSGITFRDLTADGLTSISNSTAGLYRRKYVGKLLSTYGAWTEYNATWFDDTSRGPISQPAYEVDTYVSFGYRSDLGAENGYSLEWKGYLVAPVTGNMRFFVDVDDDIMIWMGAAALAPTKDNYLLAQSGGTRSGTDGITVQSGKYYPVRMSFIEYGGAEQFQIFANSSAGAVVYNGQDLTWAHNSSTKGY